MHDNNIKLPIKCKIIERNSHGYLQQIFIQKHEANTFPYSAQDQNFPHSSSSISTGMCKELQIQWKPAESVFGGHVPNQQSLNTNYSIDIENLEQSCFCNRALTYNLLILNWFVPESFEEIFIDRKIRPRFLYQFKVKVHGHIMKISIDSYIPIKQGKAIFAEKIKNSIFPCLYEKLLAKIYGSYENISQKLTDILQIFTLFSKEVLPFYLFSKEPEQKLIKTLNKAVQSGSLIFFRTRNSVRLQTVGMLSDSQYLITRIVSVRQKVFAEFLQIDGMSWIGNYSKIRAFWTLPLPEIKQLQINTEEFSRQNYISISDLIGVSREFIILHNTQKYHKFSQQVKSLKEKNTFKLSNFRQNGCRILIQIDFLSKQCRSLILVLSSQHSQHKTSNKMIACSFKIKKNSNFVEFIQLPQTDYLLIVYAQDVSNKFVPYSISLASQSNQTKLQEINNKWHLMNQQHTAFISMLYQLGGFDTFLDSYSSASKIMDRNLIRTKCCYSTMGLGFILISLKQGYQSEVQVKINHELLSIHNIVVVNIKPEKIIFKPPCSGLMVFKLNGKYQQGQCFPPKKAIKFTIFCQGNTLHSIMQ